MDWRGFELHPETPPGGMALAEIIPPDELSDFRGYLYTFAEQFGIDEMVIGDHTPNTRRALAITEHAREQGKLHPFRARAMAAHFRFGRDLEDDAVLAELARESGLDPEAALAASRAPEVLARVDALRDEAKARGVTGIPTFFFGKGPAVVGCQPYTSLAYMAKRSGARPRRP